MERWNNKRLINEDIYVMWVSGHNHDKNESEYWQWLYVLI